VSFYITKNKINIYHPCYGRIILLSEGKKVVYLYIKKKAFQGWNFKFHCLIR